MFEKLLSVLPYNPGLSHQLAFYSRRMREEAAIRRVGMIFIVLTFMIQFFAVLSPPQPTSAEACSNNDLIKCGFSTPAEAKRICDANVRNYQDIVHYYNMTCAQLGSAQTVNLPSNYFNGQLYSVGYNPQGARNATTKRLTHEVSRHPTSAGTVYWRLLDSWGTTTYKALRVTNSAGKVFYILYRCGNLTTIGIPEHAVTVAVEKPGPIHLPTPKVAIPVIKPAPVKVKPLCPFNTKLLASDDRCDACANKPGKQTSIKECDVCTNKAGIQLKATDCDVCSNLAGIQLKASDCDVCPNITGTQTKATQCDVCANKPGVQTKSADCDVCTNIEGVQLDASECDVCPNIAGVQTDVNSCDVPVCQYNPSLSPDDVNCKPCPQSTSSDDVAACLVLHKTASNVTASIADANNTTASPGDVITYTLTAQNTGKAPVAGFIFQESLADVMDYADVADLHGGAIDVNDLVTWPAQDIAAGATATQQITVKVKDPIPDAPVGPSDPTHFDLVMTNVYGDTININVPPSPTKTVEVAVATLPNTGPGTGLFIAAAIMIVGGYFYGRARLLAKESVLAIQENTA